MLATPGSLKHRCLRSIALVSVLIWIVVTAGAVLIALHETEVMFDNSLRELAHIVLAFSDHELAEIEAAGGHGVGEDVAGTDIGTVVYQVWRADGVLAYRSLGAPEVPLTSEPAGFGATLLHGDSMRTYAAWNRAHRFQVQMAALPQRREAYGFRVSAALCVSLIAALALFIWLLQRQLTHAFAPLQKTVAALGTKSASDLSPVESLDVPTELAPVVDAFNDLLARVDHAIRHERRFTSDAAHELKTPLAGLKILASNAQRAGDAAERDDALKQMSLAIGRCAALIDKLLVLSSFDSEQLNLGETVDLYTVALAVCSDLAPSISRKRVSLEVRGAAGAAVVVGSREGMAAVLRNLVENALRHSPAQGAIHIELVTDRDHEMVELRVHDSGPGISPHLRGTVFARFFKVARNTTSGAGLGLAIVKRIAEIHGGSAFVADSSALGGALAGVRLPMKKSEGLAG